VGDEQLAAQGWVAAPGLGSLGGAAGLSAVFTVPACVGLVAVVVLLLWGRRAAGRPDALDGSGGNVLVSG